jgi:hypothetical protein
MQKPSVKKLLLIVGILTLTLVAFVAGGITMSSAQAASTNALDKSTAQAGCDKKDPKCKGDHQDSPTNQTKGIVTVNNIAGNKIQATFLEPSDKKGSEVTITTTSSTIYKPDPSVVAAGKTIFVFGTVNSDGSITARVLGFYDSTVADYGGVVTRIDGSTITVQAKGLTLTVHMTAGTTFFKGQPKTKATSPASQSDLKVGDIVEAHGKLNSDGSLTAETVLIAQPGVIAK